MREMLTATVAATILITSAAFAQSVEEKTGVNFALGIAPKTADFVKEAAISDLTEMRVSLVRSGHC